MHRSSRLVGLRWTRAPRETLDWERENVTFPRESWARKLSLQALHRLPALTALVAPGTFLPGVPGVIAAEVAAPSRSRAESQQGRCWRADHRPYGHRAIHRVHSSASCFRAPPPTATAGSFHSSTWMSQLMLSHPSEDCPSIEPSKLPQISGVSYRIRFSKLFQANCLPGN